MVSFFMDSFFASCRWTLRQGLGLREKVKTTLLIETGYIYIFMHADMFI